MLAGEISERRRSTDTGQGKAASARPLAHSTGEALPSVSREMSPIFGHIVAKRTLSGHFPENRLKSLEKFAPPEAHKGRPYA